MKFNTLLIAAAGLSLLVSCSGKHIVGDRAERAQVQSDFQARRADLEQAATTDTEAAQAGLFDIFDTDLDKREREALTFLYAYMPLADIADHSGDYFLENVRCSFTARKEMPWGKTVPEREFRHFVLPIRVNNEDLDDSRTVFYDELKDRVRGLSMYDAVLEVNHWCHEKVIYTPSDGRTSSPLASVRTAHGRCGEESTFTVAALRAVGIPARQVYTPRWAHTDDNHAWVEAWVDGRWFFFGACEPEPVLNLGWFNAPASRGMLMHTRVFGAYHGPEEVVLRTARNTEINVTENYASTGKAEVAVTDAQGKPVEGATVEFKIYNYAEFYTVATRLTDAQGMTSLSAGKGDMMVWAYKDGMFGYAKATFGSDARVEISLGRDASDAMARTEEMDIVPPPQSANLPEVTPQQRAENDRRMAVEDSIRNAYTATFMTEAAAREFALSLGFDTKPGSALSPYGTVPSGPGAAAAKAESQADAVARILVASRGNHAQIRSFLQSLGTAERKAAGLDILMQVSGKDLRDVPAEVLADHLDNTPMLAGFLARTNAVSGAASKARTADASGANAGSRAGLRPEWFGAYVRNPRIANELLTPYKGFFAEAVPQEERQAFLADPMAMVSWVSDNIRIDRECNIGAAPISPAGVWLTRVADPHSRDIFFVALSRSMGIPARIDEVTGKVQIFGEDGTVDVDFDNAESVSAPTGRLTARYSPVAYLSDPRYYAHFSISKINPDGSLRLLSYNEGELDMGGGTSWSNLLKNGTEMDAGNYLLVTGSRLADGSVLSNLTFFTVLPGRTTTLDLVMREAEDEIKVIGSFDSESKYLPIGDVSRLAGEAAGSSESCGLPASGGDADGEDLTSVLLTSGRGYYIVGLLGAGQEPTNHALRDIAAVAGQFEQWGRSVILVFPSEEQYAKFRIGDFPGLPSTVSFGIDSTGEIRRQITGGVELPSKTDLPIFIIGDTFNRVVFVSQGYTIGLGEQLMNVVHRL